METTANIQVLRLARDLGYPMRDIRKAIIDLNGGNQDLAHRIGISPVRVSQVATGNRSARSAQKKVAIELKVPENEFFPETAEAI